MGKIKPPKPMAHAKGPTYTENKSIPFAKGNMKKMKPDMAIAQGNGPTFTENSTHIETMNADKPPKTSKSMGEKSWFDPFDTKRQANEDFPASPTLPVRYPK